MLLLVDSKKRERRWFAVQLSYTALITQRSGSMPLRDSVLMFQSDSVLMFQSDSVLMFQSDSVLMFQSDSVLVLSLDRSSMDGWCNRMDTCQALEMLR